MSALRPLHPHQERLLDELRCAIVAGKRRIMAQLPTGAGKTVVSAHIVAGALAKRKRLTFCVPAIGLVDQTFERFCENGIDPSLMGVIQADHPWRRSHAPVQIATPQTLARRELPICDVVMIDEAHERFEIYDQWMAHADWRKALFVGLSATPWARGLGKVYDCLLKPTSINELITGGFLSPFRVLAPSHPDLEGIATVAGDYHEGQLAERMNTPVLTADIVETWLANAQGWPTLCFAVNRAHARQIHDQFKLVGVPVAYVDANTPREERNEIGRKLAAGEIKIVCNIGTLTKGIDWDVRCIILARPTKSEMLFVQIIGRALRTAPGKEYALILDHTDTHTHPENGLGMVTDIDHDELDMGHKRKPQTAREKAEKEMKLPKPCLCCGTLVPVGMKACGACGTEMRRPVEIECAEGELVEIGGKVGRKKETALQRVSAMGKQEVYRQLLAIQEDRGRSKGWVAHTYREVFDVWPRGMDGLEPMPPCAEVLAMVRGKDIRYAKSAAKVQGLEPDRGVAA